MAKKTDSVVTIDFSVIPVDRSGDPITMSGETVPLSTFVAVALDNAMDITKEGQAIPTTPGELRIRTDLADKIEDAARVTISIEEKKMIEKCVAKNYHASVASRVLKFLVEAPEEPEQAEDTEQEKTDEPE